MVVLKKACCCFTLRTGNLILGWFHLICGIIAIIALAAMIPLVDHIEDKDFAVLWITAVYVLSYAFWSRSNNTLSIDKEVRRYIDAYGGLVRYLPKDVTRQDIKTALAILIALCCISPIMAICHLYGSYKYRKGFLLPYLIGGGIQLGILLIAVIYSIAKLRAQDIISQILTLLICIYLYLIPWSFYKEIRDGRSPEMQQQA